MPVILYWVFGGLLTLLGFGGGLWLGGALDTALLLAIGAGLYMFFN